MSSDMRLSLGRRESEGPPVVRLGSWSPDTIVLGSLLGDDDETSDGPLYAPQRQRLPASASTAVSQSRRSAVDSGGSKVMSPARCEMTSETVMAFLPQAPNSGQYRASG